MKPYLLLIITITLNCSSKKILKEAKNGDFIFVEAKKEKLSGAISRVTSTENKISYDHIGLVVTKGNKKYLLHTTPNHGSEEINLKAFILKNRKDKRQQSLYRLRAEYQNCISNAVRLAYSMLGKPYNYTYTPNENEYYCSDFIERAFRNCSIFDLQPMTFINPETGKTDEYWLQHYQQLNAKIPEGELGCNPNGMSKSDKIYKIGTLK